MRLGFAVQVLGRPQLKSHDSRRWQNSPHLTVSLAYVRDILAYLDSAGLRMYRLQSDLAPYATHPDLPAFHRQVEESAAELQHTGALARRLGIRLSFHAHPYTTLNALDAEVTQRSLRAVEILAAILDAMGLDDDAVIVIHVGGLYGDRAASLDRFAARYEALPEAARRRLVLENDEERYSLADILEVHRRTDIRVVLDRLHFLLNNPEGLALGEALRLALATWPSGQRPKVHYSSPRTEFKVTEEPDAEGQSVARARAALWRNHSDFINPFEFIDFARLAQGARDFDVMLEAKGKDLAALRLREDLAAFAPDLAARLE
ncbi:MAG: UV DNA damage repair endonuclease UvsE [Chloroflexi bacterium]|nr:UV DNA damage repair endonuclease UvsE [Chloroflexota bacterium]